VVNVVKLKERLKRKRLKSKEATIKKKGKLITIRGE